MLDLLDVTALPSPIQKLTASGSLPNASDAQLISDTSFDKTENSSQRLEFCFWM